MVGLEEDLFNIGATSNPAKCSKLIKSIKNYIQKTYKTPDNIVNAIQQLKHPALGYDNMPTKSKYVNKDDNPDVDAYVIAKFMRKEYYKAMRARKDKYNNNQSNPWALIYNQCAPELMNKKKWKQDRKEEQ